MKFTVDTDAKLLTIEQELTFQELKAFINTLPVEWAAYKLLIKEPDNTYKWPFYYPHGVRAVNTEDMQPTTISATRGGEQSIRGVDWKKSGELPIDIRPVPGAPEPKNV